MSANEPDSPITAQEFVEQLLALPHEERLAFLRQRAARLQAADFANEVGGRLKERADYFLYDNLDLSRQMMTLLYAVAELTGSEPLRALGLRAEGNILLIGQGKPQEAIAAYNQAAAIYREHNMAVNAAISQIGKVDALARLGKFGDALHTGEEIMRVLEAHARWLELAAVTVNQAVVYARQGDDANALQMLNLAETRYYHAQKETGADITDSIAEIANNRAICLRNLGQFDDSLQESRNAEQALLRLEMKIEAARARQAAAITRFVMGQYNEALRDLDETQDIFLRDGRWRDAALTALYITDCLLELGRFKDVLEKTARLRQQFAGLGTPFEAACALLNEARALSGLRRRADALASLAEARRAFEAADQPVWVAITDLETARALPQEASLSLALACAQFFQARGLALYQARACLLAARAALGLRRYAEVEPLVQAALTAAQGKEARLPQVTYQAHYILGDLERARENFARALDEYDAAIPDLELLQQRLTIAFRSDFMQDKLALYQDAAALAVDIHQNRRAWEYNQRSKSRILIDLLTHHLDLAPRPRRDQDRPLLHELQEWRAERDRLYHRLQDLDLLLAAETDPTNQEWERHRQRIFELESRITAHWEKLLLRDPGYAGDAALTQFVSAPAQEHLPADTLLLDYFFTRDGLIVFVVSGDTVEARRLSCDPAGLRRKQQWLKMNLKQASQPGITAGQLADLTGSARGLLQNLYQLLLAPVQSDLANYRRLIIAPHGSLHYLPFHALHDGQGYVLERYEISYLPNANLLPHCRAPQADSNGALCLGYSAHGSLPEAAREARDIAEMMSGEILLEDEATLSNLRARAPGRRVVHLSTHGDFRADNPLFSGLTLADGQLATLDIFGLQLSASLVTLSACETGLSVTSGGDELLGLSHAFLRAGAASLALSLWRVEQRSTALLMQAFYRALAQGVGKADALRQAQRQVMNDASGQYAHPYFWAPFFLVGDWDQL